APDALLCYESTNRSVRVTENDRTPGLAGARNAGILGSSSDLVAFCDDDDTWRPSKVRLQVEALERTGAVAAVCGITVRYGDLSVNRVPTDAELTATQFARSRVAAAHSSS